MTRAPFFLLLAAGLAGCGGPERPAADAAREADGPRYTVGDTTLLGTLSAAGTAEPIERATLSTRLMGTLTAVEVHEGSRVRQGDLLARIDARDLAARRARVEAEAAGARSMLADARTQADRFRALYTDSAATRYQLEQAELGLARAEAGLRAAEAAAVELAATTSYAEVRAPFAGTVVRRLADPGVLAAPGMPLLELEDGSRLRITVTLAAGSARALRRGDSLDGQVDGVPVRAVVEGSIPTSGGAVYAVNAIVANPTGSFLPGSPAELFIPLGLRAAVVVPTRVLVHEGDLTGVRVVTPQGTALRWIRIAPTRQPEITEVLSGLVAGDVILDGKD